MGDMGENRGIGWMYEGAKSLVNREDYLLGKKIGKDFEKYSDVVNEQKPEALDALLHTRTVTKPQPSAVKTSALESYVVATEDPLVAVKVKEETRRRELLENPLMKLKFKKMLKEMMAEKEGKKEKKKKKKKKRDKKERSTVDEEDLDTLKKKKKKRTSREYSEMCDSANSSPKTKSSFHQRERHNSNTEFKKDSKHFRELKPKKVFEESERIKRRSRSPKISRKRKFCSSSRSSSNPDGRKMPLTKDQKRHRTMSSSSRESSSVRRPLHRESQKRSRRRSSSNRNKSLKRERERSDVSASPTSSGRRRASKARKTSLRESETCHHRRMRSSSLKRNSSSSPTQRSSSSSVDFSGRHRSSLGTAKESSSSSSPSTSPSLSHNDFIKSQMDRLKCMKEIVYKCDLHSDGFDGSKKSEVGKFCLRNASSSYDDNKQSEPMRLFDSHIPEHLRPKDLISSGFGTDSGDYEGDDEFDEDERKRKERFMGFGLVGAKKKDEIPNETENPYELSRRPTIPVYKKPESRGPLTEEEKQKKLREMAENAAWRQKIRKSNIKVTSMKEGLEAAEDMSGKAPSFLRNQLNTAAADLTVEQRLQSKKKSLQRSHGYMEQKFTSK